MRTNRMHQRQVIFSPLGHPVKAVLAPHEKWKYLVRYDFVLMHELDLEPDLYQRVDNFAETVRKVVLLCMGDRTGARI